MNPIMSPSIDPNSYEAILPAVVNAVEAAGAILLARFSTTPDLENRDRLLEATAANDLAVIGSLQDALGKARPEAGWVEDEVGTGELPQGEWWIVDTVEGNINHVHGLPTWGVTVTLVSDNRPVLTVVNAPLAGRTYPAIDGGGAFCDGVKMCCSKKTDIGIALVATGQAMPREGNETYRLIGQSVMAMLQAALVVRVTVPATFEIVAVASGQMDAFWQYSQVRSGLVSGALLVQEAGGIVTDTQGRPWGLTSKDFLASAPGLNQAAITALACIA